MTDGKKALTAGDFALAEKKLNKALDNRPDDSELWWALMLCKFRYKNDGELVDAVRAKFRAAADAGDPPPPTPFDTSYCKNALKYAVNTKRRDFVDRVSAEMSELWQQKRGKALKAPKTNVRTLSRGDALRIAAYICLFPALVGGVLGAYSIFAHEKWALWTGFIMLIVFAAAAVVLRSYAIKSNAKPRGVAAALIILFVCLGVALLVASVKVGSRSVLILAVAMIVMAIIFGGFALVNRKSDVERGGSGKKNKANGRAEYDRYAAPAKKKSENTRRKSKNVYKDEDD